jgi:hypothetical protein
MWMVLYRHNLAPLFVSDDDIAPLLDSVCTSPDLRLDSGRIRVFGVSSGTGIPEPEMPRGRYRSGCLDQQATDENNEVRDHDPFVQTF